MNITKDKSYTVSDDVITKVDGAGRVVILHLSQNDVFYRVDKIAAQSWDLIAQGKTYNQILEELIQQYPTHIKALEKAFQQLFENLISHKIIS